MSDFWTPFCPKKAGIEHAVHCRDDLACSYCGKANPNPTIAQSAHSVPEVVDLRDSPPARKSEHSQSRFSMLSTASNTARQQSITRTRAVEDRPHAGTTILSARPKLGTKSLENLTAKKHRVLVHIYTAELQDENLQTYGDWCSIR
jgi:hypothetical protein